MTLRYRDLVQFEPIESVIQLQDANSPNLAEKHVCTYVFSDGMADRICSRVIPQLSFDEDEDHKGMLVVGNYGTGKSHLMSVLSLIAENAKYLPMLRHKEVAKAAKAIAGKFKVHRIEISSKMPLRAIITQELERFLDKHGIDYSFPPSEAVVNNKDCFEEMMVAFNNANPDQGILIVVDEFLDYLRGRDDRELIQDLAFLREIGEVAKHLRFRFVAGVQEAIFDANRFQHAADSLRRVKDRFVQVELVRQDISFVVTERLLKKNSDQKNKVRSHLKPFAKFYESMNEHMDDYVELFPVHPDYLRTFERLVFTEKRGALDTLRSQMQNILNTEVPADHPGLISYDNLWEIIKSNAVMRADPNISPVLRVSEVLSERINKGFTRPQYKPMAIRIINGLSVNRLTTGGDIYIPIGSTAKELRDSLCLYYPGIEEMGGEHPDADLLSHVHTVLRETLNSVNGQFISKAPKSDQYYLDLKKDVDYDTQIEKRAETLSENFLDRAYYGAILQLMERTDDPTYVSGHQIWQHEIEWQEHRIERIGYLFFGSPNDRPTAQPPRDFYIYFIQPFDPPKFKDEKISDEVFFKLRRKKIDEDLEHSIRFYAAAQELSQTASGDSKRVYIEKAKDSLKSIGKWLNERQHDAFEVTHNGKTKGIHEWAQSISLRNRARLDPNERINFRDVINVISGVALSGSFADAAPEYPIFSALVTQSNRKQYVGSTLRMLAGQAQTKDAVTILDALEMIHDGRISTTHSRYAQSILGRLKAKGNGQVVNRRELLDEREDLEYFEPGKSRLEPDFLIVVLAGLVYSGDIVLTITGDKIDSTKTNKLAELSIDDLCQFKHIEAPRKINLPALRSLFELLELPPGLAQQATQDSTDSVIALQTKVSELTRRILKAETDISNRLVLWGNSLLSDDEISQWQVSLEDFKVFIENLASYDSVGKLKRLHIESSDIDAQKRNLQAFNSIEYLVNLTNVLGATASYLSNAEMALMGGKELPSSTQAKKHDILSVNHKWIKKVQSTRESILEDITKNVTAKNINDYRRTLGQLKKEYINIYVSMHGKARLGHSGEKIKNNLFTDPRLTALKSLALIPLMPINQLKIFEHKIHDLIVCTSLMDSDLDANPICHHCNYHPTGDTGDTFSAENTLHQLDADLDLMLINWEKILVQNFDDPIIQVSLSLLDKPERIIAEKFLEEKCLPETISKEFISAIIQALSGLEKIVVSNEDICNALLKSPAAPDDLYARLKTFIDERCKGKEKDKLRFVIE